MLLTAVLIAGIGVAAWRGGGPTGALWAAALSLYAAWAVPWWYLLDRLLAAMLYGLATVLGELGRVDTPAVVAQAASGTRTLLLYAGEQGLRRIDAPPLAYELLPEAVAVVLPLVEAPLGAGLDRARGEVAARLRPWRRRLQAGRVIWALLVVGPVAGFVVYWTLRALRGAGG